MKQKIAIDMDEVMADALGKLIRLYEAEYGVPVDMDRLQGKLLQEAIDPDHSHVIREYLFSKDFFRDLNVMPDSQAVIFELNRFYEVYIVTAAMEFPDSLSHKYQWLQEHFSFLNWKNFVFCGDKSIIKTDYMIDDHPKNLATFTGEPIIFTSPHNVEETRYRRVNNWQEVAEMFL